MLLNFLLLIPIIGAFFLSVCEYIYEKTTLFHLKIIALTFCLINLFISFILFIFFDLSTNYFQFGEQYNKISNINLNLGIDGLSIYFILLTALIMPVSIVSNWNSIKEYNKYFLIIMLLLETFLLSVFLMLDFVSFYIFFETILPPLFLLIGIFGSSNRVRATFYFFLYTLLGSLFLLLSILSALSIIGTTDLYTLYNSYIGLNIQTFLFCGVFIAFAVKTPTIFLNTWLLRAHVESPLGGSIILAGIVLKLSIYGILRLILPFMPEITVSFTYIVYVIGAITIILASMSTLRTIDIKELIAYSSVCHAAVYLLGVFSNTIQGIVGSITLGLAHGFVSSGLFICAGGTLYDRVSTRIITFYKGMTQLMPLFSVLFFILCLGNAGTPLSLNFVGEFMSLYGTFERLPLIGMFASTSIIFSAAYTIYMYNRISFGGIYTKLLTINVPDLTKREFYILFILVFFTIVLGIYTIPVLNGLNYSVSNLLYNLPFGNTNTLASTLPYANQGFYLISSVYEPDANLKSILFFILSIISIIFIIYSSKAKNVKINTYLNSKKFLLGVFLFALFLIVYYFVSLPYFIFYPYTLFCFRCEEILNKICIQLSSNNFFNFLFNLKWSILLNIFKLIFSYLNIEISIISEILIPISIPVLHMDYNGTEAGTGTGTGTGAGTGAGAGAGAGAGGAGAGAGGAVPNNPRTDEIGACTHNSRTTIQGTDHHIYNPVTCDFGPKINDRDHVALDGPGQQAFSCDNCPGVMCDYCNHDIDNDNSNNN